MDISPESIVPEPEYPKCQQKDKQRAIPPHLGGEPLPITREIRLNKQERKILSDIQQHGWHYAEMLLTAGTPEPIGTENIRATLRLRHSFDRVIKFMMENAIDIPE